MSLLSSGVRAIDGVLYNLEESTSTLAKAWKQEDYLTLAEASCIMTNGYCSLTQHTLDGAKYSFTVASYFSHPLNIVFGFLSSAVFNPIFNKVLPGVGLLSSAICTVQHSIGICRQNRLLSILQKNTTDASSPSDIKDKLFLLKSQKEMTLNKSLPQWIQENLNKKGGISNHLYELIESIGSPPDRETSSQAIQEANSLITLLQDYMFRKKVLHILALIGAILCGIGAIVALCGAPLPVILVLLVITLGLAVAKYGIEKGWVENPEKGFSFKLCLPPSLRELPSYIKESAQALPTTAQQFSHSIVYQLLTMLNTYINQTSQQIAQYSQQFIARAQHRLLSSIPI